MYVLISQECQQIRLESREASPARRFAGGVQAMPTPGGPRLVVVVAGLLGALPHPVDEARQDVAVPVLEEVGVRRAARPSALVGHHSQLMDQMRVQRPAVGYARPSRRLPHVLGVDPLDDLIEPQPHPPPQPPLQTVVGSHRSGQRP